MAFHINCGGAGCRVKRALVARTYQRLIDAGDAMQCALARRSIGAPLPASPVLNFASDGLVAAAKLEALAPRAGEPTRQPSGPSRISSIEFVRPDHLAANQAGSGHQVCAQSAGNPETEDGAAAFGDGSFDYAGEVVGIAAAHHGLDVGRSGGDLRLRHQTRGGNDKARLSPGSAHIPTATDLAFAATRL